MRGSFNFFPITFFAARFRGLLPVRLELLRLIVERSVRVPNPSDRLNLGPSCVQFHQRAPRVVFYLHPFYRSGESKTDGSQTIEYLVSIT